jgi:hypothetical protein
MRSCCSDARALGPSTSQPTLAASKRLRSSPRTATVAHSVPSRPFSGSSPSPRANEPAAPARVITPARTEVETSGATAAQLNSLHSASLLTEILTPVKADLDTMNVNLKNVVGSRHPMLMAAADQIFGAGGKKLRPVIVFLVARATMQLMAQQ